MGALNRYCVRHADQTMESLTDRLAHDQWISLRLASKGWSGRRLKQLARVAMWLWTHREVAKDASKRGHRCAWAWVGSQRKMAAVATWRGMSRATISRAMPHLRSAGIVCLIEAYERKYSRTQRRTIYQQKHEPIYLLARSRDEANAFERLYWEAASCSHRARTVAVVRSWTLVSAFLRGVKDVRRLIGVLLRRRAERPPKGLRGAHIDVYRLVGRIL